MTLAKCAKCGKPLIVPYDGLPFWCIDCLVEDHAYSNIVTERDKVLDDLIIIVAKRCECNQDIEHADILIIHLDELGEIIAELRTASEQP